MSGPKGARGRRFEGALDPVAAALNASVSFDQRLLPHDVAGSIAHAPRCISSADSRTSPTHQRSSSSSPIFDASAVEGDTWQHLVRTTFKRMFVAMASSVTAGYLTPLALLLASLPDALLLSAAFGVGGGAQRVLLMVISKFGNPAAGGTTP